jgi:hypothetical protein
VFQQGPLSGDDRFQFLDGWKSGVGGRAVNRLMRYAHILASSGWSTL